MAFYALLMLMSACFLCLLTAAVLDKDEGEAIGCPEGTISVKGIDRLQLLLDLWIAQEDHGYSVWHPQKWSHEAAKKVLARGEYIDYFQGRAIKMNLGTDCIDPRLYNRDTDIKAEKVVESIRRRLAGKSKEL
jgi:hypothetical protein